MSFPGSRAERFISGAILTLACVMPLVAYWPGRLNADSRGLLAGARGDLPILDHWTATLTWAWRMAYELIGLETGGVLLVQTAALVLGLYLVLRSCLSRVAAALLTLPVVLAPPTFGFVGLVGRDAWFVAGCVLAAGFAVTAARCDRRGPRATAIAFGALAGTVAIAARQNGFTAVAPVFAALAATAIVLLRPSRVQRRVALRPAAASVTVGLASTVAALAAVTGADRTVREHALHPETLTYLYDLGYLTLASDRRLIPRLPRDGVLAQTPAEVRERWRPESALYMRVPHAREVAAGTARPVRLVLSNAETGAIGRAWRRAILDRPIGYLRGRALLWRLQAGIGHTPAYVWATPSETDKYGYKPPAVPVASTFASRYSSWWAESPASVFVYQAWVYLLICAGGLALALPRFAAPVRAAASLAAAAVGLQVGLFLGAPAVEWRFQLIAAYGAMVVLVLAAGLMLEGRRRKRAHA